MPGRFLQALGLRLNDYPPPLPSSPLCPRPRSKIEVFCYALTPSDGSEWRARIEAEAEHFADVSGASAADIARRISADGIHVSAAYRCGLLVG